MMGVTVNVMSMLVLFCFKNILFGGKTRRERNWGNSKWPATEAYKQVGVAVINFENQEFGKDEIESV
jgi:hypothetical protein